MGYKANTIIRSTIYIRLTIISERQRGTFAILYFTPESVDNNYPKEKKRKKYIYIYIYIYVNIDIDIYKHRYRSI